MKILVSGSSGLVGSTLIPFLSIGGHEVFRLIRRKPKPGARNIYWKPTEGEIDMAALEGMDAVIHLAGESIAKGRWTEERKKAIRDSRVQGTRLLCHALSQLQNPPKILVAASAVGFYGNRGDEILTEVSEPGQGFLADVCWQWERATDEAAEKGIRVVNTRFGVIFSHKGGALKQMLPIFKLGAGGPIGNGKQYMSWVDIDDVVGVINHVLLHKDFRGPVNIVSPHSTTNMEFAKTLGHVLFRPAVLPLPALAVQAIFGEMGQALLLTSQRAEPLRLIETGYRFQYPTLESSLRHQLRSD